MSGSPAISVPNGYRPNISIVNDTASIGLAVPTEHAPSFLDS
eukprot:CAMPEP_0114657616 /NCGR_PEP_ID=MMETSP0191-20121206/14225_1 /TAXON_ID=126664 /ORGANISM="Sorites sp." /LENGTH=41 /DNA_ID= /DNA_START= /DNA_END= /DNA_ORIENTATION=